MLNSRSLSPPGYGLQDPQRNRVDVIGIKVDGVGICVDVIGICVDVIGICVDVIGASVDVICIGWTTVHYHHKRIDKHIHYHSRHMLYVAGGTRHMYVAGGTIGRRERALHETVAGRDTLT
eukprot:1089705-Prorocentrum_minimum.AAC.1